MSTITSSSMSLNGLAASLQARLLAQDDTNNGGQAGSGTATPSLASVLMSNDAVSGPSSQAAGDIASLMMDIQQLTLNTPPTQPSSADIFSAMDTNGDGQVTQAEFVAAKPDGMSSDQATALFKSIDAQGTGSITQDQFAAAVNRGMQDGQSGQVHHHHRHGGGAQQVLEDMFSVLDSNSDGQVTQAEFLSAKPDTMTGDQASALFSAMDTSGTGSINEGQFATGLKAGLSGQANGASTAGSTSADIGQVTQDLMRQLLQVIQNVNNNYVDAGSAATAPTQQTTA